MSTDQEELASVRGSVTIQKMIDDESGDEDDHHRHHSSKSKSSKSGKKKEKSSKKARSPRIEGETVSRRKKRLSSESQEPPLEQDEDDHNNATSTTSPPKKASSKELKKMIPSESKGKHVRKMDEESTASVAGEGGSHSSSEDEEDEDHTHRVSMESSSSEEYESRKKHGSYPDKSIRVDKQRKRAPSSGSPPSSSSPLGHEAPAVAHSPPSSSSPSSLAKPPSSAHVGVSSMHTGPDGKSIVVAAAPTLGRIALRVPLRVRPGIRIAIQPSSGFKHVVVPIEIENTTTKPLEYFSVSLNYIQERSFVASSILMGSYEYTTLSRFHVKRFKFKSEPEWPLPVGQKYSGTVRLSLSEDLPPSIDATISPLFSRTYYARIRASGKGLFTKQKVSQRVFLLIGDYDYNTRPLPIQHVHNTPIRFTIFTLPAAPYTPNFVPERGGATSADHHGEPTLIDTEQSEVVDLETSSVAL